MIVSSKPRVLLIVGLACAYWFALFVGTHLPSVGLGESRWLDKLVHSAAYFGLAVLHCAAAAVIWRRGVAIYLGVFGIAVAYGAIDELSQLLVPGRTASFWDWMSDVAGATCGILVFYLGTVLWRRRPNHGKDLDLRTVPPD